MIYPMSNIIMIFTINSWNVSESSQAHNRMSYSDMSRFVLRSNEMSLIFSSSYHQETIKDLQSIEIYHSVYGKFFF